jgi:hypothetical protein
VSSRGIAATVALSGMLSIPDGAPRLDYPTANIPRLPNGKPNLSAPAPRKPNGQPDLSGIWRVPGSGSCEENNKDPQHMVGK